LRPNPAGEAARRWTITPKRFLPWWRSKTTGRWTRSLRRCGSTGYPEAARRCSVFWSVAALHTKKVLHASEQEREDVARARRRWIREQGLLDSTHLVFIDESVLQRNGRSSAWTRTVREAAGKMGAGPPGSAFRSGSQTSPSCCGKEPWW